MERKIIHQDLDAAAIASEKLDKQAVKALKKAAKESKKEEKRAAKAQSAQEQGKGEGKAPGEKRLGRRGLYNGKNKRGKNLCVGEVALRACDVDLANRWRPSAIFVSTQEFGELASTYLNCSHQDLADKGAFFVLLRQRIEVMKYPRSADLLRCETWAGEVQRTLFPRFYRFFDEDDQLCATSATIWALCSMEDRKIIRPQDIGLTMPPPPYENLEEPGKLRFAEAPDMVRRRRVRYSDMDYNGHVNNTRYVDWCCDLFPNERFEGHSFRSFQVNYLQEMREECELRLELRDMGESFAIRGVVQESDAQRGDQVIFQAAGSWMDAPRNEKWRMLPEEDEE